MALRREFTEDRIRDTWDREHRRADFSRYGGTWRAYLDEGYSIFEHPPSEGVPVTLEAYIVTFRKTGGRVIGQIEGTDISVEV